MIRYYSFDQRSEKWHIYRKGKWTGSTAIDLLKGKKTPPESDPNYDNKYMQRGRILEPLAVEAYEKKTGHKVRHFGFVTNSKYPHAGYSPDGIDDDTIIEVKCVNEEKHMAIGDSNLLPTEWIAQTHFGTIITELKKIRFVLYNPDAQVPLFIIDVEVQPDIVKNLTEKLEATRPKQYVSADRAKRKYRENNPLKIKETRRKAYLKSKEKK